MVALTSPLPPLPPILKPLIRTPPSRARGVALDVGDGALDQQLSRSHLSGHRCLGATRRAAGGREVLLVESRPAHVGLTEDDEFSGLIEHVGEYGAPGIADIPLAVPPGSIFELGDGDGVSETAGCLLGCGGQCCRDESDHDDENK